MTLTFDAGDATETMTNTKEKLPGHYTYMVDGGTVTFPPDNGERFVMRWVINGDQLTLIRDESLGVGPTPT